MSFRTPWKPPVKVATAAETKITNPLKSAHTHTEPPINQDFEATEGSQKGAASGPSSPEGSKCTADSEDTCLPNDSECLKGSEGSNCSQTSKGFSCLKHPNKSKPSSSKCLGDIEPNVCNQRNPDNSEQIIKNLESAVASYPLKSSNKSEDSKVAKSPQCSEDPSDGIKEIRRREGESSEGFRYADGKDISQKARDAKLSNRSKMENGPKNPKCKKETSPRHMGSKRPQTPTSDSSEPDLPGLSSLTDSKSLSEDSPHRKVSKAATGSDSKYNKGSKRPKISKKTPSVSGSSSEDSTSSTSEDESPRSSQIPSQATSRGSQFLKQEAPLILSPPPKGLDARARLAWIQERRDTGVWVYCDNPGCDKQRYLADVHDPATLPEKWFCRMNRDPERNTCEALEVGPGIAEEEDMIVSAYTAGSLVWARLDGYPEWPAMVDDDPDLEQYYWCSGYSEIPTDYHVTFFDSAAVSRAWLKPADIRRFSAEEAVRRFSTGCRADLSHRLKVAHSQAVEALPLGPLERLRKFSFITRYVGKINPGRKRTPPTPRRFLEMQRKRNKKHCRSEKLPSRGGRPSQKLRGGQKKKHSKKTVQGKSGSVSSEDKENPFSSDSSSDSSDEGPPSKKPYQEKSPNKSSQASSKAASKMFSKPIFKARGKSPIPTSQKSNPVKSPGVKSHLSQPVTAKSPTSTYNTPSEPPTRPSQRKLWLELDSSSDSEEEFEPSAAAQLPAPNLGRTGETESFVSIQEPQVTYDEEPASEDSIFAVAGSVCSFSHGIQPARKRQDCILTESMDSDFIENTPVDLLNKPEKNTLQVNKEFKLPSEAAAVPYDDELEASSEIGAKPPKPKVIDDTLSSVPQDDDFTDMGDMG